MNHAATAIKQVVPADKRARLLERFQAMVNQLEQHPAVRELRQTWPRPVGRPDYFGATQLEQYAREYDNCQNCTGMEACPNEIAGYARKLDERLPALTSVPCSKKQAQIRQNELDNRIKSQYIKPHILNSTFEELATQSDPERKGAIVKAMTFCHEFEAGKTKRGLYFHGPMGRGKSSIAGAMAKKLADDGVDVVMVYVPHFIREIKEAIQTNSVAEKIASMQNVSVLILDDIGAEQLGTWTRDEILGPILQERMETQPTIYTSNLTLSQLENHLANVPKEEKVFGVMKAQRIMERIAPFVTEVEVFGRNWRREGQA